MQNLENKRVFCLVVLFGFETKNYFESGLFKKLVEKYKVVVLKRNFKSKNFDAFIEKYDLDVVEFDEAQFNNPTKVQELYTASRKARQRINGGENFNYFKADRDTKFSDYILGNFFTNSLLKQFSEYSLDKNAVDKYIEKVYKEYKVTDLLMAGYSSKSALSLARTAQKNGLNIWLTINSWKDFFVNSYIPFNPTKIFSWNEGMKKQIVSLNSHIEQNSIEVVGNLSFDRFYNYTPVNSIDYYSTKYGFNKNRPIILYTMISPRAYPHEKDIIELINKRLIEKFEDEEQRPIIVLRSNPIDETELVNSYYTGNNVVYADNYFDASYKNAVFCQLGEGENEWLDLLHYCKLNINVASTVTLEALLMNKPVINIEFSPSGKKDQELSRYSSAPFYKPLLNRKDVSIIDNIDDCINQIIEYKDGNTKVEDLSSILVNLEQNTTDAILGTISSRSVN